MIIVREARHEDVPDMGAVMIASITELCESDHKGDPTRIASWTSNKTSGHIQSWIADPSKRLWVAILGETIVGVGCLSLDGQVLLNYVAPAHRFSGVSRALMDRMEAGLAAAGFTEVRLTSTVTAQRFYRDRGYVNDGPGGWDWGYPMVKSLAVAQK